MILMVKIILVFLIGLAIDVLSVFWNYFVIRNKALYAATLSLVLTSCVIFGILNIVKTTVLIVPYLAGVFIGAYIGVRLKQKLERLNE